VLTAADQRSLKCTEGESGEGPARLILINDAGPTGAVGPSSWWGNQDNWPEWDFAETISLWIFEC
jgi:hypothetical protein